MCALQHAHKQATGGGQGCGALSVSVSATGKLAPTNQVQVGSELSGLVTKVVVDVNDRVTQGQPLALVDPSRFQDAVNQSQAALNAAFLPVMMLSGFVYEIGSMPRPVQVIASCSSALKAFAVRDTAAGAGQAADQKRAGGYRPCHNGLRNYT